MLEDATTLSLVENIIVLLDRTMSLILEAWASLLLTTELALVGSEILLLGSEVLVDGGAVPSDTATDFES